MKSLIKVTACIQCLCEFTPTAHQIKKSDFKCKTCVAKNRLAWIARKKLEGTYNPPRKRTSEENRAKYEKHYSIEENRQRLNARQKRYREDPKSRFKHEARWMAKRAIQSGKLIRQPCEVCGEAKVDAHHDDYEKPLDVRWLCRKHHAEHHNTFKEVQ